MTAPPPALDLAALYADAVRPTVHRLDRIALIDAVVAAVRDRADVVAAWEGGSAAWGRADAWSDADLQLLAADDDPATTQAIFAAVEAMLAAEGGITRRYAVPEPAWHGHSQRFYHLAAAGAFVMLDLVVVRPGVPERFLAPQQHGRARVLFDRGAPGAPHTAPPPFDAAAHRARLQRALDDHRARFDLFQPLVVKEVARGRFLDALGFYHGLTLRPLVAVLGIRHRPLRFDFGLRYLHLDLPPADAERLGDLHAVRDLPDLAAKHPAAAAWFHAVATDLDVASIDLDAAAAAAADGRPG